MTLIIILFIVAFALMIGEVAFPSFGMLGLLAAGAFLMAIMKSFEYGRHEGVLAIVAAVILVPVAFWLGIKVLRNTPIGSKFIQQGPKHEEVASAGTDRRLDGLPGQEGVAITVLRPSGIAEFAGKRVDVTASSAYVEPGTRVRATHVEGNIVVVEVVDATPNRA